MKRQLQIVVATLVSFIVSGCILQPPAGHPVDADPYVKEITIAQTEVRGEQLAFTILFVPQPDQEPKVVSATWRSPELDHVTVHFDTEAPQRVDVTIPCAYVPTHALMETVLEPEGHYSYTVSVSSCDDPASTSIG